VRRADNLTTYMCRLSRNLGASNSWNPKGLSRPVMELLFTGIWYTVDAEPQQTELVGEIDRDCFVLIRIELMALSRCACVRCWRIWHTANNAGNRHDKNQFGVVLYTRTPNKLQVLYPYVPYCVGRPS
jgi:hypothetical protein